ncbi:MAG: hypothetical protein K2O42_10575, partial [Oscillospiraceae bacterium]|nr:hypothetical protein [Oscillospiraceae bacterium]
MDDVLILVKQTKIQDEFHIQHNQEVERQIFCKVQSVSRSEFFSGGQNGLHPVFLFEVFPADYHSEPELIFHNVRYAIYRTFLKNADALELYAAQKGGIQ